MPRRLRLEFGGAGHCDLTGLDATRVVVGFQTRNFGVEYDSWPHPLSPYYQSKKQSQWLPVHPQPGGVGWWDWYGLTVENAEQGSRPAQVVSHFKNLRARSVGCRAPRVTAFGVDFDNMKCRSWVDAAIPLFIAETEAAQDLLQDLGGRLTRATEIAASALRFAVKCALFATPEDASGNFARASAELWAATEGAFYAVLSRLAHQATDGEATQREASAFQRVLATGAPAVFDRWCPVDSVAPVALRRVVSARYVLTGTLSGHGKQGSKLYGELQIAPPMGGARKPRASRKGKQESQHELTD
jgi:CRISPR system Cascade subunit CasA